MKKTLLLTFGIFILCGGLATAQHNQLWGMTGGGLSFGHNGKGDIFHYNTDTMNLVEDYGFPYTHPGTNPQYTYFTDMGTGKFYGMTLSGGVYGYGVIFEWDTLTNVYIDKYDFDNINGANPTGSLLLYGGKLYGTTANGGTASSGVLFEWDPATNTFTKKHDFDGATNGKNPTAALAVYGGKLYGMTNTGGSANKGTVYKFDPSTGIFTKTFDFTGLADGSQPYGGFKVLGTHLYATTAWGGANDAGSIVEYQPSTDALTLKVSLNLNAYRPFGDLTFFNNKFYGLAYFNSGTFAGAIFEWDTATAAVTPKFALNNLYSPAGTGYSPKGSLTVSGTKLYGMTWYGGEYNAGTLFSYDPVADVFSKKFDFGGGIIMGQPAGTCIAANNTLYGLTSDQGNGAAFKYRIPSNTLIPQFSFQDELNGNKPQGTLAAFNGKYYGLTSTAGVNYGGVIFEYDPATHTYTDKLDFGPATNSGSPYGSMVLYAGKFYGMAGGGTPGYGVIFEWNPLTNAYVNKVEFNGANGSVPYGDLKMFNGKFYGMTSAGGANSLGNIFEWDPVSNILTDKIDFDDNNGSTPYGSLMLYNNKFYGLTSVGGLNGVGVIFEWDPTTNIYVQKYDFAGGALGGNPYGNLSLYAGKLYGMTNVGGTSSFGVIFEYNLTTNVYTRKISFDGAIKGQTPYGSLTASGGKFYGMTYEGGANNYGTLFEWNPATNLFSKKYDFGYDPTHNGVNPGYNGLLASNAFPVLSHLPDSVVVCSGINATVSFNVTDADGDPLTITSTSSNTALLPNANVVINYVSDSTYHVTVSPIAGVGGTSTVNVIVNDGNGGEVNFNLHVTQLIPPLQDVCSVTVDSASANHNIIYWDKSGVTTAVDSFRIYREVTTGVYSNIASVFRDSLSEYHDFGANPNVTSYKYKIAVLDTCGNVSPKSLYHSTIHLQVLGGGNLQWTLYDIESSPNPVVFYRVLRDDGGTGCCFNPISTTIPGGNTTYTDLAYASFPSADYRMEVTWSLSCTPTRTLINTTRSNIKHQNLTTGITEEGLNEETEIYPNPAQNDVTIELSEIIKGASVSIFNALGQKVFEENMNCSGTTKTTKHIDISSYAKGVYTISIESNGTRVFKKLIVN